MAVYNIRHVTRYIYEEAVPVCHNVAHLLPRASPRHEWRFAEVDISPAPAVRTDREDYFGNRLTFFAIQEPHLELEVTGRGQVAIEPRSELPKTKVSWEEARDQFAIRGSELLGEMQFSLDSPYVHSTEEVAAYGRESFAAGRPLVEAVLDLTARIHRDFAYDTKTTTVSTTLPEVMKARSGVCQDFAHLQIGCLRAMGLAARYVSGYLLTSPPPGKPRLVGADASHAWASVWVPGEGWLDVDPTNNLVPSDKHITVGFGRDFGDVSPLRGVILGGGRHQIEVSVDVAPVDAECNGNPQLPNF
ncbi:MAG TPA: transglutaminase family protein [Phycisphaerae bacterium]|nr:transglutaminase family protein [Phycisphaerae bacterium]